MRASEAAGSVAPVLPYGERAMKLQIDGQQLRFRVDEAEFARLIDGEVVELLTLLPDRVWLQQVQRCDGDVMRVAAQGDGLRLWLPLADLLAYRERLPCRDGLSAEQALPDGNTLALNFEVDVRDSVRTRGPRRKASL